MKTFFGTAAIVFGVALAPSAAGAGERVGDALMGATAGAIVGGPVGAVAGGAVGYTAGPDIARGLGLKDRRYRHLSRRTKPAHKEAAQ
jgi:hypothetical protein